MGSSSRAPSASAASRAEGDARGPSAAKTTSEESQAGKSTLPNEEDELRKVDTTEADGHAVVGPDAGTSANETESSSHSSSAGSSSSSSSRAPSASAASRAEGD